MNITTNYTSELFDNRDSAEKAYDDAIALGYKPEEINVLMSEESRKKYYDSELVKIEPGDKSMEGMAIGGSLGGVVGGTLGAIAAIGAVVVFPGVGLVIAGPLAAGLAGAGVGSISGGLIGSLIGWGFTEERAALFEKGIKSGGIVLGVKEHSDRPALEENWKGYSNRYY